MYVDLVERAAKAMAEADLWPGAWDGNMPHGYAMHDAEKNLWYVRAEAALAAVTPLIAAAEREACAKLMEAGQPFVVPGYGGGSGTVCHWWAADAASAIRAREEVK